MTETKYFCDRCHDQITRDRTCFKGHCGPGRRAYQELDLCPECCQELLAWIDPPASRGKATSPAA